MYPRIQVFGLTGMPEFQDGDSLAQAILAAADAQDTPLRDSDVLVVTQKIVSKAEGCLVDLNSITPSRFANSFADQAGRDPRLVELVLRESRSVVRMDPERGVLITETHHGLVCANAGIDSSNIYGEEMVALLPRDPDRSARTIRDEIRRDERGANVAVIVSDTFGRAWREGHVDFAIGVAGMEPIKDYIGTTDAVGKQIKVTRIAAADELAAAAELAGGKSDNIPVAVVRGYPYDSSEVGSAPLLRERSRDLFR